MTNIHSIIGIFPSNEEADIVVLELQKKASISKNFHG